MRFETEKDLNREKEAISLFVSVFGGSFKKLDPNDVDYKIFDKDNKLIAYAEVKGRYRTLKMAFPLPIAARKVVKLADKRIPSVVIWACDDGILYGLVNEMTGSVKWGGREPRNGAGHDKELMIYYDRQKEIKYVRY